MGELAVTYTYTYIYTYSQYIINLVTWMDIHGFLRPGARPGPRWTIRGARLQLRPGTLLGWQRFREEREQIERGHDVHLGNFLRGDLDLDIL